MPCSTPHQEIMKHPEKEKKDNKKIGATSTTLIDMKSLKLITGAWP